LGDFIKYNFLSLPSVLLCHPKTRQRNRECSEKIVDKEKLSYSILFRGKMRLGKSFSHLRVHSINNCTLELNLCICGVKRQTGSCILKQYIMYLKGFPDFPLKGTGFVKVESLLSIDTAILSGPNLHKFIGINIEERFLYIIRKKIANRKVFIILKPFLSVLLEHLL
jgi:hypothetical protein